MGSEEQRGGTDADPAKIGGGLLEALAELDLGETMPADVFDARWDA